MRFGHVVQFLACVATRVVASPQDDVDTLFAGTRGPKPHCAFEMCPKPRPGVTNLHFVAHTHLDIGWTRRFQENYLLAKDILESVCGELMKNRYRMFTVTEMAFFKKWFEEANEVFKIIVRKYINEGRLELASGGWVMNDEASTLYTDVVDQMTLGHRWINATFGPCALPRAVWQLDPFGHSKEQAALFGQMEFDGLLLGRIHYLDHDWRRANRKAEFLWQGDDSLKQDIFTAVLPQEYSAPVGLDFTSPFLTNEQLKNSTPLLLNFTRESSSRVLEMLLRTEGDQITYAYSTDTLTQDGFRTNQKIVMFGDDFAFYNATRWYSGMDSLMDIINSQNDSGFYAFYSTPGCFLRSLNAEWTTAYVNSSNEIEPVHKGDFFPYSDKPGDLWTGFYSSRPSLKYLIRRTSNFLQACRQITVLANITETAIDLLDKAVAMAQHHDAITGTCTEPVAKDFGDILGRSYTACEKVMALGVEALITLGTNRNLYPTFCHLLNQSECFASEGFEKFFVSVYNPRSSAVKTVVRFPVANSGYKVTDEARHFVPSEIVPIQHAVLHLPERQSDAVHELIFMTAVPPLGISTFLVERFRGATIQRQGSQPIGQVRNKDYVLKNRWYKVTVDSMTCLLKSIVRMENGKGIEVQQNFAAYSSSHGHYLFSPDNPVAVEFKDNITCRIITTTLVHEVHQWINPWISQVIRLYVSEDYVEFDWTLGPVPLESSQGTLYGGHDVVTRFQSNLDNAGVFFTDSNGKLTVRRVANSTGVWKPVGPSPTGGYAESVEANYYPVVSWLYLRDNATGLQMTLLPDRPQGGTGYRTGQLELMVQRRLTASDNKGLEDPLDDRGLNKKGMVIRGRHLLHLAPIEEAAVRVRAMANALVLAPVLSFSDATLPYSSDVKTRRFRGLATQLPIGVQLLTLYQDAPGRVLMRLEHMQPAVPPDELATVNVTIPINAMLSTYTMKNFREVSLTASRWKNSKFEPLRWTPSNRSVLSGSEPRLDRSDAKGALTAVQLFTGEIRTFVADL